MASDKSPSLERSDSDESDSSESEAAVELLVAGREKRSTAGNRLRNLLDVETLDEDDEAMGIFAETEDDADFESEEEEEQDEDEEDEEQEADNEEGQDEEVTAATKSSKHATVQEIQDDEMLSESEDSDDEGPAGNADDSDAGEKELQRQEKLERARKRKRQENRSVGFAFPKPTPKVSQALDKSSAAEGPKTEKRARLSFENAVSVRASSRAHAIKNKEDILQRLQEEEKRRADNYIAPKVKPKEVITQAERIERAKLIEERNVASLNKFYEQEVSRKKSQRAALFAQRRIKLGPFVRWRSVKTELPADSNRRIVEEIDPEEWRKHIRRSFPEADNYQDGSKPAKRHYKKRVKIEASAVKDAQPDTAKGAELLNPPGPSVGNDGSANELVPAPSVIEPKSEGLCDNKGIDTQIGTQEEKVTPSGNEQDAEVKRDLDQEVKEDENSDGTLGNISEKPVVDADAVRSETPDQSVREDSQMTEIHDFSGAGTPSPVKPAGRMSSTKSLVLKTELLDGESGTGHITADDDDRTQVDAFNRKPAIEQDLERVETAGDRSNAGIQQHEESIPAVDGTMKPLVESPTADHAVGLFALERLPASLQETSVEEQPAAPEPVLNLAPFSIELLSMVDFPPEQRIDAPLVRSVLFGSQMSSPRPPTRAKRHLCPISGLPVRFRDPVTGVCYSSLHSFKIVRQLLSGSMPWNASFGEGFYYGNKDLESEWKKTAESQEAKAQAPKESATQ